MSNFNVKDFENLSKRSEDIFNTIVDCLKGIRNECKTLGDIVSSDDSSLGSRWSNVHSSMAKPISNIEDTYLVIKALLNKYIENTIANEEQAAKELEEFDADLSALANEANEMITGFSALKGIGIGASAIVIPGLAGFGDDTLVASDSLTAMKYAPPTSVTKYAPPTAVTKYAPPTAVTKYAPPTAVTKYAPPTAVTKYAPPTVGSPTPYATEGYIYNDGLVRISLPSTNVYADAIKKSSGLTK